MSKFLTVREPLTFRQTMAILTDMAISYESVGDPSFIAFFKPPYKKPMPSIDEICDEISDRTVSQLKNSLIRAERQDRKGERLKKDKYKSWSPVQRRKLLGGKIRYTLDQTPRKQVYQSFYKQIQDRNCFFPEETRGPKQWYDRVGSGWLLG